MNLVIVGSIGLDDIKTPFGKVEGVLGGSAVYAASAASYFIKPGLISIKGNDLPDEKLRICGADLKGLQSHEKTFRWSGCYEFDMNEAKTLDTTLNSLANFRPQVPKEYLKSKYVLLGNMDPEVQLEVINQIKNGRHCKVAKGNCGNPLESKIASSQTSRNDRDVFIITDTMNYWIASKKDKLLEVLSNTHFAILNEGEARQLTGNPNLIKAGKQLLDLGPKYVAIKKGEHGALLFSNNEIFSAPSYPLEDLVDPTGAGDSFAGGAAGYLSKTNDTSWDNIKKAIIYGSSIASFCAESFSLDYKKRVSIKNIEERNEIFRKIREF